MRITVTTDVISDMKSDLRRALPAVGSSHLTEALARGLGWRTNAALRASLADVSVERDVQPGPFSAYLSAHAAGASGSDLTRSALRVQIRAVMKAQQGLTHFGFGIYGGNRLTVAEWRDKFAESRTAMLTDYAVAEFARAREYLTLLARTKNPNRHYTSYNLKHAAERYHKRSGDTDREYVSNGMLLAAAYHLGLRVARVAPDAWTGYLNVSSRSFKELDTVRTPLQQPDPGQHFRVLGFDRGHFYYLPAGATRHVALRPDDHIPSRLLRLAPLEYWTDLFPPRNRRAPFDTEAAIDRLFTQARKVGIFEADR